MITFYLILKTFLRVLFPDNTLFWKIGFSKDTLEPNLKDQICGVKVREKDKRFVCTMLCGDVRYQMYSALEILA